MISSINKISPMMYDSAHSTRCHDRTSSTSCQITTLKFNININLQETNHSRLKGCLLAQPTVGCQTCVSPTAHDAVAHFVGVICAADLRFTPNVEGVEENHQSTLHRDARLSSPIVSRVLRSTEWSFRSRISGQILNYRR